MKDQYKLPPINLFSQTKISEEENIAYKKEITKKIIEFFAKFKIQLKLSSIKEDFKLSIYEFCTNGEEINTSDLAEKLSIHLNIAQIKIEVLGNHISFNIPNKKLNFISLRSILETKEWKSYKGNLPITLGRDINNTPIIRDLSKLKHLIILGLMGSGRISCLDSIIISLLSKLSPKDLKFLFINSYSPELSCFEGLPHSLSNNIRYIEQAFVALRWLSCEMQNRYKQKKKEHPRIVCVINECSNFIKEEKYKEIILALCQKGAEVGIHLIFASWRLSKEIVDDIIYKSFPTQIVFKTGINIIDDVESKDLSYFNMLMKERNEIWLKIHGTYESENDKEAFIDFISKHNKSEYDANLEKLLCEFDKTNNNPILEEAKKEIKKHKIASIPFLQKKLSIGLSVATKIMKELEEEGFIERETGG